MKLILAGLLLLPFATEAKTLHYTWLKSKWWCQERVSTGRNSSEVFLKPCSSDNLWDIHNRDDVVWLKNNTINSNTYSEHKPSKPINPNCGLKYNPKNGVTYRYPKCVYTFRY